MVLQVDVLIGKEIVNALSLDFTIRVVQIMVVDLSFSLPNQLSDLHLNVLMVVCIESILFISSSSPIKAHQERLEHRLPPFKVKVHDLEPKDPRNKRRLSNPIQISCGHSKVQNEEPHPECHQVLARQQEVLIVGRNLFRADHVMEELCGFNRGERQSMMVTMVGVAIYSSSGFFHSRLVFLFDFLEFILELVNVAVILFLEVLEVLNSNCLGGKRQGYCPCQRLTVGES